MQVKDWAYRGLMALAAVALAGCTSMTAMFRPERPPPVEIVIPPVGAAQPAVIAAAPPALPRPKPVMEAPLPLAGDFVGLSVAEVRSMIGKPTLLREDHKIQVWHYQNLDCTLFLFFYPQGTEGYRVRHVDVANTSANPAPPPGTSPSEARRQTLESCVAATMISYGSKRL